PEVEPSAARGATKDGVQQPNKKDADDQEDELALDPVPGPRAPALHGDAVTLLDAFAVDLEWQGEDGDGEQEERRVDDALQEALGGETLGPIAEPGGKLPAQDQPEHNDAVGEADQVEAEVDGISVMRFLVEIGRKSVGGDGLGGGDRVS